MEPMNCYHGESSMAVTVDITPLRKGAPLQLYAPDGCSQCLDVKSVVKLAFLTDVSLGSEAVYGFVIRLSPEEQTGKRL
ncbi:hypothetical protein ACFFK0_16550 [Paenibacillus chartarius]|uniref:Uncharacterized protein n=1 Tax=Paenibacillus chartarius TaxID=747481 RepID=A0ABV6DN25_9BACL